MQAAAGAAGSKTYVDDVFSTYVYEGTGSSLSINNGINASGKGALTWIKKRNAAESHNLFDTERGAGKYLSTDVDDDEGTDNNKLSAFNDNGFTVVSDAGVNGAPQGSSVAEYVSWTFRKAKGFFDIVTYTGNGGSSQTVSHSLGCIPGMMMVKNTSSSGNWNVYHRGANKGVTPAAYRGRLNMDFGFNSVHSIFDSVAPTATTFELGTDDSTNASGDTYVAYLFAGGESTADKAVDFDGSGDYLSIPDSTAWDIGTNYTAECFFNIDALTGAGFDAIFGQWPGNNNASTNTWTLEYVGTDLRFYYNDASTTVQHKSLGTVSLTEWHHFAFSKDGSTTRLFVDGDLKHSFTISLNAGNGSFNIGGNVSGGGYINGKVSNVRVTKDQALYKTNFNVPSDPLTTTSQGAIATNVKLLCCNGSTTTASTVTPGTITANGDPAVTTNNSLFDDTSANVFGDTEDQDVIKCGSYIGNGTDPGPEIFLGWEPSWIMLKRADSNGDWGIFDTMRGIPTGGSDKYLRPNLNNDAATAGQTIELTATGFKLRYGQTISNLNNAEMIYVAIRRPDGYVGKPAEAGTDVFTMATGNSSSTIPSFTSNFPVDFVFNKQPASTSNWEVMARLIQGNWLKTNEMDEEASYSDATFDSNIGCISNSGYTSNNQAYMWKRHAGFDVVTYTGDGVAGRQISHSLSQKPQMMWIKNRSTNRNWVVYHEGLNGGTNPAQYELELNSDIAENQESGRFNDTEPTSTQFTIGTSNRVNNTGDTYIAMLFASSDGISKISSYDGSDSTVSINLGFQPRFLIVKNITTGGAGYNWFVFDTVRGWGSGNDKSLMLDNTDAQSTSTDYGAPTSTGFDLVGNIGGTNDSINGVAQKYIYYAHA